MRKIKFPKCENQRNKHAVIFCKSERVLALYNNCFNNQRKRKRVTDTVKEWFKKEALNEGWKYAYFVTDSANYGHSAGCLLFVSLQQENTMENKEIMEMRDQLNQLISDAEIPDTK